MRTRFLQVDAFTDRAFAGNPAGVVLLDREVEDAWRQDVAAEINVAETAFLEPLGPGHYRLRWFTPTAEVPLCGHATLASAHALWIEHEVDEERLVFATASGNLRAHRDHDDVVLDLPALQTEARSAPEWLADVVGARNPTEVVQASNGMWIARFTDAATVRGLTPDLNRLASVEGDGLIVTAPAEADADVAIVSRYFAPHIGIPEDPVTGAAHCALAPYWAKLLGTTEFAAEQASRRGGRLGVRVLGDRVELRGRAVTTLRGEILA